MENNYFLTWIEHCSEFCFILVGFLRCSRRVGHYSWSEAQENKYFKFSSKLIIKYHVNHIIGEKIRALLLCYEIKYVIFIAGVFMLNFNASTSNCVAYNVQSVPISPFEQLIKLLSRGRVHCCVQS